MTHRLDSRTPDFQARFSAFLTAKREVEAAVDEQVSYIINRVRELGDAALAEFTLQYDGFKFSSVPMVVSEEEIETAYASVAPDTLDAMRMAYERIRTYHARQKPEDCRFTDSIGVELGWRWSAIESVGIYVPGGKASYPSSVLMNAVPAKVAGVERIVMAVPAPEAVLNPLVLAAAKITGVTEVLRIGGAQAIAALAYGTGKITPVAKIVGPGNAYVAAAKKQVFGLVGIDMIAGPSEILVLADGNNDPQWIAADLLAQAEHDSTAQSILITNDAGFASDVELAIRDQLTTLPRREIATRSWQDHGAIIIVGDFEEAVPLANAIASEHVEVAVDDAENLALKIRNAGAIFIGRFTPEVIGDYVGGSNHVLPTARTARFSSGLSVPDFMKRTSILKLDAEQLSKLGPAAVRLAREEGLDGHGRSVSIRLNRLS